MKKNLPVNSVHLDFHTSPLIDGIGAQFRRQEFIETLRAAKVERLTVFAKCHHGYCYYPTKVGKMHPGLSFDLLGEQLSACREAGISPVVYLTVGWSVLDLEEHPEWQVVYYDTGRPLTNVRGQCGDGKVRTEGSLDDCTWDLLCTSSGYADHVVELVKELCRNYDFDGLFFDIACLDFPCVCEACCKGMRKEGKDPASREEARAYMVEKRLKLFSTCREILFRYKPEAEFFCNSGGAEIEFPEYHASMTHFELENLPTSGGGYDKIVNRSKFFVKSGKDFLGMTGKFHTDWGEFGGFKHEDALVFECGTMMMYGAKCSIGDHCHPSGKLDPETYRLIGRAFDYAHSIQPYCYGVQDTTRLGVLLSRDPVASEGLAKLLLENQLDYALAMEDEDFSGRYDCIVVADDADLTGELADKLLKFVNRGGSLLLTASSVRGIDLGITYEGKSAYDMDYIRAPGRGVLESPLLAYESAHIVKAGADWEVLAELSEPYFSRTPQHYSGHRNTPNRLEPAEYPAAVQRGNVIYLAHPVARIYQRFGNVYHKRYFRSFLNQIYKPILQVDGLQSIGRVRLTKQTEEGRLILHLTYAPPIARGGLAVLEDMPVVHGARVRIHTRQKAERIVSRPQGREVFFEGREEEIVFEAPPFRGHQIIEIKLKEELS